MKTLSKEQVIKKIEWYNECLALILFAEEKERERKIQAEIKELEMRRPFKVWLHTIEQPEVWFSPKDAAEHYGVSLSTTYRRLKMLSVNPYLALEFKYIR